MFKTNIEQTSALLAIKDEPVVVAVSGGSDSLALLLGLIDTGFSKIFAVTIDHGLRKEASDEACFVNEICNRLEISHQIISVTVSPEGNIQANARDARYQALTQYCQKHKSRFLMLGHTADDQVETFLMRAFRGSGVDGLSAIAFMIDKDGVKLIRPMLCNSRTELRQYLYAKNLKWIDDPSNENLDYDRIKIRKLFDVAREMGLEPRGILRSIENISQARDVMDDLVEEFLNLHVKMLDFRIEAKIDRGEFSRLSPALGGKVLMKLCKFFGGNIYAPRKSAVVELMQNIKAKPGGGMVIGHCDFHWSAKSIRVCSEAAHISKIGVAHLWTHNDGLPLFPLGKMASKWSARREHDISYRAAMNLPAIFENGKLINFLGENPSEDNKYKPIHVKM